MLFTLLFDLVFQSTFAGRRAILNPKTGHWANVELGDSVGLSYEWCSAVLSGLGGDRFVARAMGMSRSEASWAAIAASQGAWIMVCVWELVGLAFFKKKRGDSSNARKNVTPVFPSRKDAIRDD